MIVLGPKKSKIGGIRKLTMPRSQRLELLSPSRKLVVMVEAMRRLAADTIPQGPLLLRRGLIGIANSHKGHCEAQPLNARHHRHLMASVATHHQHLEHLMHSSNLRLATNHRLPSSLSALLVNQASSASLPPIPAYQSPPATARHLLHRTHV